MTMFGVNIQIEQLKPARSLLDREVDSVLKRAEERQIFGKFLKQNMLSGEPVADFIVRNAESLVAKNKEEDQGIPDRQLQDFAVSELKKRMVGRLNLHDVLIRKIVEDQNPNFRVLHTTIDNGKFDGKLPFGYPDASKKAAAILTAKIADSRGSLKKDYLKHKAVVSKLRSLTREMFFAINKLGLQGELLLRYMMVFLEIETLYEAEAVNPVGLKEAVGRAIKSRSSLNIVHIKCLRFVYPREGGVKVLTDTSDVVIEGVLGRYSPKSEKNLFSKLLNIKRIFQTYEIDVNFRIVVADNDLDLLFPPGSKYAGNESIAQAKKDSALYIKNLSKKYGADFLFTTLSQIIYDSGESYHMLFDRVMADIKSNSGTFVEPNFFERDRVNHQYMYYRQLFGEDYSRDEARRSISEQTAGVVALQEVLKPFGLGTVLVEENRGGENKLIANGSVPIIFTKLRDEAKFDVE